MPYSIDSSSDRCYPGTSCLMNKFDIHDAQKLDELESSIVYGKLALLQHIPIPGSFDFAHYKRIHQFLFCDLYDWAGQIRDVDLFKKGTAAVPHLIWNDARALCLAGSVSSENQLCKDHCFLNGMR